MELIVHIPQPAVFLSEVCRTGKAVDGSQVSHRFESSLPIFACSSSPKLQETQLSLQAAGLLADHMLTRNLSPPGNQILECFSQTLSNIIEWAVYDQCEPAS